jgi:hypothetical protein
MASDAGYEMGASACKLAMLPYYSKGIQIG